MSYPNLYEILENNKKNMPVCNAYGFNQGGKDIYVSYDELFDTVCAYGAYYSKQNCIRVGILGSNSYKWMCTALGLLISGNKTVAFLDPLMPIEDLEAIIERSDLDTLICDDDIMVMGAEISSAISGLNIVKMEDLSNYEGKFVYGGKDSETLFYTSGTTKNSKIVVTPLSAIIGNTSENARLIGIEGNALSLIPLPFNHSFGFCKNIQSIIAGNTIYISSMIHMQRDIKRVNPDILYLVASAAEFLAKKKAFSPSVKKVITAGSYMPIELADKIKACGPDICNEYGSSEIPGGIGVSLADDLVTHITLTACSKVVITNDEELAVETPNHFKEYYKDAQATAETLHDGSVYTGDSAVINPDGKLQILGRKKNMILMSNGEKLLCTDVDERIKSLHGVNDGAVVYINEKLYAVVELMGGASVENVKAALKEYNDTLPVYRKIRDIYVMDNGLPYTSSGKLMRRKVEEFVAALQEK